MTKPFKGIVNVDVTESLPDWGPYTQPIAPEEGYHLTTDLTDRALAFIQDTKAIAPDKPFFLIV